MLQCLEQQSRRKRTGEKPQNQSLANRNRTKENKDSTITKRSLAVIPKKLEHLLKIIGTVKFTISHLQKGSFTWNILEQYFIISKQHLSISDSREGFCRWIKILNST